MQNVARLMALPISMKHLLALLAAASFPFADAHADAEAGGKLFERICQRCHTGSAAKLAAHVDQLPALLNRERIAKHRFVLTDQQVADLAAYLRTWQ